MFDSPLRVITQSLMTKLRKLSSSLVHVLAKVNLQCQRREDVM